MKAAKLLREGCRTAANLLRPRMDMTEGFETLESLWPDTKGEWQGSGLRIPSVFPPSHP